jgi:hypothetical protein
MRTLKKRNNKNKDGNQWNRDQKKKKESTKQKAGSLKNKQDWGAPSKPD